MPASTVGLYTIVQNTSGVAKSFGFLGKHGRRLAAGQTYAQAGDLVQLAIRRGPRHFKGLERSLKAGRLAIIASPGLPMRDATTGDVKVVVLSNGVLGLADPGWGAFEGVFRGAFAAPTTPRSTPVASIVLTFGVPVTGFTVSDLSLTRGGAAVPLVGVTATSPDNRVFTIGDMTALTGAAGVYVLNLAAASSGISDIDGNAQVADISTTWTHS